MMRVRTSITISDNPYQLEYKVHGHLGACVVVTTFDEEGQIHEETRFFRTKLQAEDWVWSQSIKGLIVWEGVIN
jgi:hypothetical protein